MTPGRGAEVAGAPGEVLAERPGVVALGVAGAEDAVHERVAARAGVVEVALVDHVVGVAERRPCAASRCRLQRAAGPSRRGSGCAGRGSRRGPARGSRPPAAESVFWHVIAAALALVFLAADSRALTGRLSPSAIVALTVLFFFLPASAAGAATSRPAAMAATGRIRVKRFLAGTAATSMDRWCRVDWRFWSTRRAVQHESFGSPASSESPVALRPALADGLPFREARTLLLPSSAGAAKPSPSIGRMSESRCDTALRRGVAQPG